MLRRSSSMQTVVAVLLGFAITLIGPKPAEAQEPIPNVLPRVVFLVHGGADMSPIYTGTPKSRWDQHRSAAIMD